MSNLLGQYQQARRTQNLQPIAESCGCDMLSENQIWNFADKAADMTTLQIVTIAMSLTAISLSIGALAIAGICRFGVGNFSARRFKVGTDFTVDGKMIQRSHSAISPQRPFPVDGFTLVSFEYCQDPESQAWNVTSTYAKS